MTFYPPSRPRRVTGGLRSRTARGSIGESWWSRRFVDVLESFALGSRLTRGRAYARAGQVLSLDVAPGEVTASVQGSRARPYQVQIALAPFRESVWAKVEAALAEQALYSAQLLAGTVPPGLEEVFAEAGAPLFPRTVRDLRMRCSCPDSAVPCKHLAATFYLLAEALDDDPFRLLHWRGRTRDELLGRLRALRGDGDETRPATVDDPGAKTRPAGPDPGSDPDPGSGSGGRPAAPVGTAFALADLASPALSPDLFWQSPVPLPRRPPILGSDPDLLLRQLPEPGPVLGGADLISALAAAYARFPTIGDAP